MGLLTDPQAWIAFGTLTLLEIILGVDNVVFISILAGRLPEAQRDKARRVGLGLAMVIRILLLLSISWVIGLTAPLFTAVGQEISGRDLILLLGGLFLLGKSTHEVHGQLEGEEDRASSGAAAASFSGVIVQILLLDIIFLSIPSSPPWAWPTMSGSWLRRSLSPSGSCSSSPVPSAGSSRNTRR